MKKILILFFSCILCFGAVDVSQIISAEDQGSTTTSIDQNLSSNYDIANKENNLTKIHQILVFGAHLLMEILKITIKEFITQIIRSQSVIKSVLKFGELLSFHKF